MSKISITSLSCPQCTDALHGLGYDKIFFCKNCKIAVWLNQAASTTFPLKIADAKIPAQGKQLHLPVWRMNIEISSTGENKAQAKAIKMLADLQYVWVTGFFAARTSYFGDIGLNMTESFIDPEDISEKTATIPTVVGCTRDTQEAIKYGRLFVMAMIDKRADITDLKLKTELTDLQLWAVPFDYHQGKITDQITGKEIPAFAVDDLDGIVAFSK